MSQAAQPAGQADNAAAADDPDEISSVSPLEVKCPCECSSNHGAIIEKTYKWVKATPLLGRQVLRMSAFRDCDEDGVHGVIRFSLPASSKTVCLKMHCAIYGIAKSVAYADRQAYLDGAYPSIDRATGGGRPPGPGHHAFISFMDDLIRDKGRHTSATLFTGRTRSFSLSTTSSHRKTSSTATSPNAGTRV